MKRALLLAAFILLSALPAKSQTLVTGTFNAPNGLTPQAAGLKVFLTIGGVPVCGTLDFQAYANGAQVIRLVWNNVTYFPQRVRAYVRCSDGALISAAPAVGISLIPNTDAQPAGTAYQLTGMLTSSVDGTIAQQTWVEQKQIPDQPNVNWGSLPVAAVTPIGFAVVYGTGAVNMDLAQPLLSDNGVFQWEPKNQLSIKRISCSTDTGSVSINLDIRTEAAPNTPGTPVLSVPLVCSPITGVTTTFSQPIVPPQSPVALLVSSVNGAPAVVRIHTEY